MIKYCIICILGVIFSCTGFSPEPEIYNPAYTPEIMVFSVISNDESYEFVIVEKTFRINEYDERDNSSIIVPS